MLLPPRISPPIPSLPFVFGSFGSSSFRNAQPRNAAAAAAGTAQLARGDDAIFAEEDGLEAEERDAAEEWRLEEQAAAAAESAPRRRARARTATSMENCRGKLSRKIVRAIFLSSF